ncbi:MAG: HAMP domain-containing sensor histidine kinase [Sarcina sp.]
MKFNKIGKKLYLIILVVLVSVFGITYYLNNFFLEKYYVYSIKQKTDIIYNIAKTYGIEKFESMISDLENQYNATIIDMPNANAQLANIESFNENLILLLDKDKVNITKLWINEKNINLIKEGKFVNIIFYQTKLQSNYFAKVFVLDNHVIFIGKSTVNDQGLINIANKLNLIVIIISILISLFLVWLFTRKIVNSINQLKNQASEISKLKFSDIEIKTNDEIEELSKSINKMSFELEKAHNELNNNNEKLKELLSSMSHEIKTPLALIKAYGMGIKDGLDDGSFIDVILSQVDETTVLIDRLLQLSKAKREKLNIEKINLSTLLIGVVNKNKRLLEEKELNLDFKCEDDIYIDADLESIRMVFNNFISNSIKYNKGDYIKISLSNNKFEITNKADIGETFDLEQLWEPFYVVDQSRAKKNSGTGLGLSIVASILEAHNFKYGVARKDDEIKFFIDIN